MARLPFGLLIWRYALAAFSPAVPLLLQQRAARGKEDRTRAGERLGIASIARPEGDVIWVHGASMGECFSVLPLIKKLLENDNCTVLVTSGTVTSAEMLQRQLPPGAVHQYVPIDTPRATTRFLEHWKPQAALFVESDIWPNLILAAAARGVRMAQVNARISARSFARWRRVRPVAAALLACFDVCLAQDEEIAARFRALGAPDVRVVGSLKADAPPLSADAAALDAMKRAIGARPVLLAAQTHPGEDETLLPAHDTLRARYPDLLTIIVPRHPERGAAIEMLCGTRAVQRRAAGGRITPQTAVYIADTLGELGLFYRLAPFCFVGGTLVPMGGHNPLEPAKLHCAVLAGPHVSSAQSAYAAILEAQGFGCVTSSADIASQAARLLADPTATRAAGEAAAAGAARLSGAVMRTVAIVQDLRRARA
jgi:3-deoxy-D-manno-octulosonic-acid transferase